MPVSSGRYYETVKWVAEFLFVPLHWMMLSHWYSAASTIGTMVMVAYMTVTWHHAKTTKLFGPQGQNKYVQNAN